MKKSEIRKRFREAVFERAGYQCECCGVLGRDRQGGKTIHSETATLTELDAHHITNRNDMPNGGYVPENGIAVCTECHLKAEEMWSTGVVVEGFAPEDLYRQIGSLYERALTASEKFQA